MLMSSTTSGPRSSADRDSIRSERGFVTAQYLIVIAFTLFLLTAFLNVLVYQYGRGVVRGALDAGARAGSPVGAGEAECYEAVNRYLDQLLGGSMGATVNPVCGEAGGFMVVTANDITFQGWTPLVPDWTFNLEARAVKEQLP